MIRLLIAAVCLSLILAISTIARADNCRPKEKHTPPVAIKYQRNEFIYITVNAAALPQQFLGEQAANR